jgi:DNA-3-methyladenine glycosylase
MTPLSADYFADSTLSIARDLLGKRLVRLLDDGTALVGRIVETEAYTQDDPAFHGWGLYDAESGTLRREGRAAALFGPPGTGYVYLIYGMHWLLNVVTEPEGIGGAVLIRAIEPLQGRDVMQQRRSVQRAVNLTNGPGKLTQALAIDEAQHGTMLTHAPLFFAEADDDAPTFEVATSSRIGISKAVDRPWRFFIEGHPYVSPATPSDQQSSKGG